MKPRAVSRPLLIGLLGLGMAAAVPPAPADAATNCGTFSTKKHGTFTAKVSGNVSCGRAKAVARGYALADKKRCEGSGCFIRVKGWNCGSASVATAKRWRFSCQRGSRTVTAQLRG